MQRILKERDRLLRRTVRYSGLASCLLAAICILLPGGVAPLTLISTLALVGIMAIAHYFIGERGAPLWMAICLIAGNFAILLLGVDPGDVRGVGEVFDPILGHNPSISAVAAISVIGAGVLGGRRRKRHTGQGRVGIFWRERGLFDEAGEAAGDAGFAFFERGVSDVGDDHRQASLRSNLGDAGTHLPCPNDAHDLDAHCRS